MILQGGKCRKTLASQEPSWKGGTKAVGLGAVEMFVNFFLHYLTC